jgi:hypothetical protein
MRNQGPEKLVLIQSYTVNKCLNWDLNPKLLYCSLFLLHMYIDMYYESGTVLGFGDIEKASLPSCLHSYILQKILQSLQGDFSKKVPT